MNYLILHLIICIVICLHSKCQAQYCGTNNVVPPWFKNDPRLCNNGSIVNLKSRYVKIETRFAILLKINYIRSNIQNSIICSLPKFEWNFDLENMAANIIEEPALGDFIITKEFRNIRVFKKKFNATECFDENTTECRERLVKGLQMLINDAQLKNKPSNQLLRPNIWWYSAYSNKAGCSYTFDKTSQACTLICLINGIVLNNFNQSFGYEKQCENALKPINRNLECNRLHNNCKAKQHFVCDKLGNFSNAKLEMLEYTSIKFILNKLEAVQKHVVWDYDLQNLANQIVNSSYLDENLICLAIGKFKTVNSMLLHDIKYFTELISNIENVWNSSRYNISDKIGCALFDTDDNFNIYCLYTPKADAVLTFRAFLESCNFYKIDRWILFASIVLVYSTNLVIILFLYCAKRYERIYRIFWFPDA